MPTLNAAATLPRTLAALRREAAEVVASITVCDGGSRDATVTIASEAGAQVVQAPTGRGRQLATGAQQGRAPWLLFVHADTRLGEGWATAARQFIGAPGNPGRAGYFRLRFDTADRRARQVERLAAWRCRRLGLPYGDQGLLIARSFYEALGGFRPLVLMEDVDLVRRIGRGRLVPLPADAVTSASRYERDGWRLRPLRNLSCLSLYFLGAPPSLLRRLYG